MKRHLIILYTLLVGFVALPLSKAQAQLVQKREFRGAWIQVVNGQFQGMSTKSMQQNLTNQLNELQRDGVNAIMFQVRPECDALYESKLEPWSRFLTGVQGQAPSPYWDPLEWMVNECHKRGMELHAWINPYRAKTKTTSALSSNHVAIKHPGRVFLYDGQFILNPALKENREYIYGVVEDIVQRYDIDGLHMDDYFYPYPVAGQQIDDARYFQNDPRGFKNIGDWRRDNVNVFVKELGERIKIMKPWVKFGVSPFGIFRNRTSDPQNGSDTRGLQNYDDLYADVLLWVNNGWVDYVAPQLYWQIGHSTADYKTLIKWWSRYASNRHLYIGEDVERTVMTPATNDPTRSQISEKFKLHQETPYIDGTVLWYSKAVVDNMGNYGTALRTVYWRYPALQPIMPYIDGKAPKSPKKLKLVNIGNDLVLFWTPPKGSTWTDRAERYVVYRFMKDERIVLDDPSHIVAVTNQPMHRLSVPNTFVQYVYVVTALDRMSNESKPAKVKVKF